MIRHMLKKKKKDVYISEYIALIIQTSGCEIGPAKSRQSFPWTSPELQKAPVHPYMDNDE